MNVRPGNDIPVHDTLIVLIVLDEDRNAGAGSAAVAFVKLVVELVR
jgi:hypothetical protein